jgi:hypothetical protein
MITAELADAKIEAAMVRVAKAIASGFPTDDMFNDSEMHRDLALLLGTGRSSEIRDMIDQYTAELEGRI